MLSLFDEGAFAPCPAPFNLTAHVLAKADRMADKIALAVLSPSRSDRWSYAKLKAAVLGVASGLLQRGFEPGDILLMRLGNTVEFPIAYLSAIAVGMVPVPTSPMLTDAEVEQIIAQLSPKAILWQPGIACPTDIGLPILTANDMQAMHALPPADYHMGDPNRLAYIIYTSGTSGQPRAVCHAHRAIWARQMMFDDWYGLTADDRLLHAGAFNWTFTLGTGLLDPWTAGATALIPANGVPMDALPLLLKRHDASIFAAAPGVYRKILQHRANLPLPKLRHGLAAGEKLSSGIRTAWSAATGCEIYEAFGMSECSTFLSACPGHPARDGALGRPQQGRRIAVLGPNGVVPHGTEGVIAVHRDDPGLMLGYFGDDAASRQRFRDGWFLTGDHGIMQADGQIIYAGRADDMMNAGGYRVSPLEVEAVLQQLPGIDNVGVTEVTVKQDVKIIAAFYTAAAPLDPAQLSQQAAEKLASYKCPKAWIHLPELPSNANGKLNRRALQPLFTQA